jgi:PadR family transcriptional regulator, regulatory protein AphA
METSTSAPPPVGLEFALLGVLRKHPSHAYELHQALQTTEPLGLVWRLKQSNLYALLGKLEAAGYIESVVETQGVRPPRKMLQLTANGQDVLRRWLQTPVGHGRDFRLEFLAKLSLVSDDGEQAVTTLLVHQRDTSRARLVELERAVEMVAPDRPFERLVLQFRVAQLEAILSWLITCQQTLTHISL